MEKRFCVSICFVLLLFSIEGTLGVPSASHPLTQGFQKKENLPPSKAYFGVASWYSESDPGINLKTADGKVFDDSQKTCASWDFPFGTHLRVTHLDSGKMVVCRVNDRGPAKRLGRLIDLTKATFREMAPLGIGLISVKVEMVESPHE